MVVSFVIWLMVGGLMFCLFWLEFLVFRGYIVLPLVSLCFFLDDLLGPCMGQNCCRFF